MKKKILPLLFSCLTALCVCSCSSGESPSSQTTEAVTVTSAQTEEIAVTSAQSQSSPEVRTDTVTDGDIDLTTKNSTMTFAIVSDMMTNPEDYIGRNVKAAGPFYAIYDSETDTTYFYLTVTDALACCEQGIEFIWDNGTHVFPDEYPELEAEIEIEGVFGKYDELGQTYYYIDVSILNEVFPAVRQ